MLDSSRIGEALSEKIKCSRIWMQQPNILIKKSLKFREGTILRVEAKHGTQHQVVASSDVVSLTLYKLADSCGILTWVCRTLWVLLILTPAFVSGGLSPSLITWPQRLRKLKPTRIFQLRLWSEWLVWENLRGALRASGLRLWPRWGKLFRHRNSRVWH